MVGDVLQIAVGLYFVSWIWWFPSWLTAMRHRAAEQGQLDRFNERFGRVPIAIGLYGVPAMGVVLVVSGVAFLALGD